MFDSLSVPENHAQCLALWALILTTKIPNEPAACALLDALIHGNYSSEHKNELSLPLFL